MDPQKKYHAFTISFNIRTNVLFTKVHLSEAFDPNTDKAKQQPLMTECNAIWDTGASSSSITKAFAAKLGFKPTGVAKVRNTSGEELRDTFLINVYLPNKVAMAYVRVVECKELVGDFEFLVGMDIIGAGDFSVTHGNGKTTMSYRLPSAETIDYVPETASHNAKVDAGRKPKISKSKLRDKRKKERQNMKKSRKKKR